MRFVLVTALFALLIVGTSLPAAAAGASDHIREKDIRDRTVVWSDGSPKFERQRVARATTSDTDEDYEARPRQRYQSGDEDRPRAAKRQHAGKAKHARRHQHAVRRTARKVAHRDGRRQRRADTPAWTRRSLGETGSLGSGQRGVASFYWQPQRVASGGWFNPNAMTAAHRTLRNRPLRRCADQRSWALHRRPHHRSFESGGWGDRHDWTRHRPGDRQHSWSLRHLHCRNENGGR